MSVTCIICVDVFTEGHELLSTNCGHVFHKQCIDEWLSIQNTCPQCRRPQYEAGSKVYLSFENGVDDALHKTKRELDAILQHILLFEDEKKQYESKIRLLQERCQKNTIEKLERQCANIMLEDEVQVLRKKLQEREAECTKVNLEKKQMEEEVRSTRQKYLFQKKDAEGKGKQLLELSAKIKQEKKQTVHEIGLLEEKTKQLQGTVQFLKGILKHCISQHEEEKKQLEDELRNTQKNYQ